MTSSNQLSESDAESSEKESDKAGSAAEKGQKAQGGPSMA